MGKRGEKGTYRLLGEFECPTAPSRKISAKAVLGIDPGISGSFVLTDGEDYVRIYPMPLAILGKDKEIPFTAVMELLSGIRRDHGRVPVFLERAVSFGMGTKGAFNYGRGFETLSIALKLQELPVTLVEPNKWTKEMHAGTSEDLRAKMRSLKAVERLYPQLVGKLPRRPKGGLHDGPVDALLIAGYGLRQLGRNTPDLPAKLVQASHISADLGGRCGEPLETRYKPTCAKLAQLRVDAVEPAIAQVLRLVLTGPELAEFKAGLELKAGLEAFLVNAQDLGVYRKAVKGLRQRAFARKHPVSRRTSQILCDFANEISDVIRVLELEIIGDFY